MKAPNRKIGLFCLLVFILALVGVFVPLAHVPYAGAALGYINLYHEWLLIAGYALLLLAIYIL